MSNYTTLVGAEDVSRAASSMREAAREMSQAASSIENSLWRHQQFMEQWLYDYQTMLEESHAKSKD